MSLSIYNYNLSIIVNLHFHALTNVYGWNKLLFWSCFYYYSIRLLSVRKSRNFLLFFSSRIHGYSETFLVCLPFKGVFLFKFFPSSFFSWVIHSTEVDFFPLSSILEALQGCLCSLTELEFSSICPWRKFETCGGSPCIYIKSNRSDIA